MDDDAVENIRLLREIDEQWPRDDAVELLSIAIEAVVENYRVYRDYNTTTTQSDHGEMLYMFVDFLRQRAAYDRIAWNLKPVVWAHEILVRQGQEAAAEMWRQAFAERTSERPRPAYRAAQFARQRVRLAPDDRRSTGGCFIRPLVIDGLRAMVEPAMDGDDARRQKSFDALEHEIAELVSEPHGSGLDVPYWLSALEDEVTDARSS